MLKGYWNPYQHVFAIISCLLAIFIIWQLTQIAATISFLLLILIVILNGWLGGIKPGLFTTLITVLFTSYYFLTHAKLFSANPLIFAYEIVLFGLIGVFISFVIEKYKKTNIASEYKQKEKAYLNQLKKLESENSKMQKEIKLRDEFLSIASHELKTPLTSMLLKLQTVLHNVRNVSLANFSVENLLKMLETAEQQTKRLSRMINDLLNVSLITTGKFTLEVEKADLTELVKQVSNEFTEKLKTDGYSLKLNVDKPVICFVDKLRIEQVIANLISNAIKYGKSEPIEIMVTKNDSVASLSVTDHGIGIPNELQKRIFEKFERVVSNHDHKGLGVGLYITAQIVKAHRGTIKLKSKLNSESTFTIELPLKKSEKINHRELLVLG